ELAHTWSLDHVVDASDPMTYASFTGMRQYKDGVMCGSDCDSTCPDGTTFCNTFGIKCSGSHTTGTHMCMSTGTATQNDVQTILNLFGPSTKQAPTLAITKPAKFSGQPSGFSIEATCTSSDPVVEVDLEIDGVRKGMLTAPPFTFTAPALADGPHHVSVI